MIERLQEINETASVLDGLLIILMTCAEKGDLPAGAYVETLGLATALIDRIRERAGELTA